MNIRPLIISSAILCMSTQSFAEGNGHESHQAHIHGVAEMTMILQNNEFLINFESPSANIVGFEHQPETNEQNNAINAAILDLQDPTNWLQFDGGDCNLLSSTADTNLRSDHAVEEHSDHADEEHSDHADEEHSDHADEEHSDHAGEEHSEHATETHTEFTAEYHYACDRSDNLESAIISLQSNYPNIEHIVVQWIVNGKQGATELEDGNQRVLLR